MLLALSKNNINKAYNIPDNRLRQPLTKRRKLRKREKAYVQAIACRNIYSVKSENIRGSEYICKNISNRQ